MCSFSFLTVTLVYFLRYGARSVGDILDVHKHTYVNVTTDEDSQGRIHVDLETKKPVPLPRSALLRQDVP